ncbi:MAG: NTP transferase domain-containing protein [Heliobacteriaceae bacterium]|nr:NTP transferase domain-containing protein [Heliobacteriaceae bacterium]MDD4587632.1 NTP transferase domain-containing protein [Heliobacteriaceae bacterium]
MDAIVLAASPNNGPLQDCDPASMEALIPIGRRPMVDYVVEALLQTGGLGRIVVVGPDELGRLYQGVSRITVVPGGMDPLTSFECGLAVLVTPSPLLLVATGDLPLLTPRVVENFLRSCNINEADFFYPIVRREDSEKNFPGVRRTYVQLCDGEFTGGNLFLISSGKIGNTLAQARDFVRLRKRPVALSRLLGWRFMVRFLLGGLNLAEVEGRVSRVLGLRAVAVIVPDPELGIDVDKPSDLTLVRQRLPDHISLP